MSTLNGPFGKANTDSNSCKDPVKSLLGPHFGLWILTSEKHLSGIDFSELPGPMRFRVDGVVINSIRKTNFLHKFRGSIPKP